MPKFRVYASTIHHVTHSKTFTAETEAEALMAAQRDLARNLKSFGLENWDSVSGYYGDSNGVYGATNALLEEAVDFAAASDDAVKALKQAVGS